ncbi:hypothetical protein CPB86DRAFT_748372 [Serendipita vermifera]|nr:hypothetical protein CPB86DRAFT_748372 [Serendipita vermifera]
MFDTWGPGDLDIYTPHGKATLILEYLIRDGYSIVPKEVEVKRRYMENGHLSSMTKLRKGECTIDILESLSSSSITPITVFHSTAVMNYITADSIVMLYPLLTFSRITVCHYASSHRNDEWQLKYILDRSYTVQESYEIHQGLQHLVCLSLYRRPKDRFCLSVSFGERDDTVSNRQPGWIFASSGLVLDQHARCTVELCKIAHYYRHAPCAVAIEVIARATFNLYPKWLKKKGSTSIQTFPRVIPEASFQPSWKIVLMKANKVLCITFHMNYQSEVRAYLGRQETILI